MAALNEVMEAWFEYIGHKQSREYLRAIAARVATPAPEVVPIRCAEKVKHALAAKVWLQSRLPEWLARHG